jgi:hypothetical protein
MTLPACNGGPCNCGRNPCPTPDACQLAEPTTGEWVSQVFWPALISIALVAVLGAIALLWPH